MNALATAIMRKLKGTMLKWMPGMLTCMEFEDFMIGYLEGDLSATQRRVFELHIAICRECRDYMAAYRRTIEVAGRAFDDGAAPVPQDVPEDLVHAILQARRS